MNLIGKLENIKLVPAIQINSLYRGTCILHQGITLATLAWFMEIVIEPVDVKPNLLTLFDFELASVDVLSDSIMINGSLVADSSHRELLAQNLLLDFFSMPKLASEHQLKYHIIQTLKNAKLSISHNLSGSEIIKPQYRFS